MSRSYEKSASAIIGQVSTRRGDVTDAPREAESASRRLGGITLWGVNQNIVDTAVDVISASIVDTASSYLTITKAVLRKKVGEALEIDRFNPRLFSAVLGSVLRSGELDALVCGSRNDRPFRALIHCNQFGRWAGSVNAALEMFEKRREVAVRELEGTIFGGRAYNTWSSASHVLGWLSYRGVVRPVDDDKFVRVDGLQ